jgi:uncharacterized protein YdeI (YjbR/CyaY-like superfamily)
MKNSTKLKRDKYSMPDYIKQALEENDVASDYELRPAYQKNDYIGWIERAKRPETKEKRLKQMLNELKIGGIYMKMQHPPSTKNKG